MGGQGLGRLTVQAWVQLVLGAMAVLVVGCAIAAAALLSQESAIADQLIDHTAPARTAIGRLQAAVIDQETGVHGFQITHDEQFLGPYNAGVAAEAEQERRVRELAGDRKVVMDDLTATQRSVADWRRRYAEPIMASARAGDPADAARLEASRHAFDGIRARFRTANLHIDAVRAESRAELHRTETRRNLAFGGMLLVFLLTGVALGLVLRRTVGRSLDNLGAASRRVASGDFGHPLPAEGPADIRALAEDMEAMRERITEALAAARAQQADLDGQADELRRSNAELEQFAYVASHDLQEPLRKVASFCQLLEKRYADKLDERGVQYIEFAVDGAKRMQVLINDLLAFSRVGRLNDARETVELDRPLDLAIKNLAASIEDSGATVTRPAGLPEVTGDPTLLGMLWQNLVGNAIKFRDPARPPAVAIAEEEGDDGSWQFCVTDNGIGIPPEFADKVFVIFQRLHARDTYGGTGIGLAMCKKIVEHHGGRIWIDTDYTGGARICFTLPRIEADQSAVPEPALEGTTA
jgi:signal transduction histidine kinase